MGLIPIDSLEDARIDVYRDLHHGGSWRRRGRFVVEGQHLVTRLVASRYEVESVLLDAEHRCPMCRELASQIDCYIASKDLVEQLVGFRFHRGVLACGKRRPGVALGNLATVDAGPLRLVVCAQVSDGENLGALIRSAAAFGVHALVVTRGCADPFARRVTRVAMGANLQLPLVECDDPGDLLEQLGQRYRVWRYAAVLDCGARALVDVEPPDRWALVFGNEGDGLSSAIRRVCDQDVTIGMAAGIDSLNVAVAGGIFLYHLTGRRG